MTGEKGSVAKAENSYWRGHEPLLAIVDSNAGNELL
jgi:hypothetical protein